MTMVRDNTETRRIIRVDDGGNEVPSMAVPAVPVQKVQTKYTTAIQVQNPRELAAVEHRALQEASLLGADAFYSWGAGKNLVEGPSKELAMALVRCYGNCAVDMGEMQETRDAWIFTATFVDFETGFNLSRQFRQAKDWQVYGKMDDARKDDMRFQIGQSKATRNVILNALPGWLVARALDKAKGGVREKVQKLIDEHGLEKVQRAAMKSLAGFGATEERVLEAMGRKAVAALTLEDLVLLEGNLAALRAKSDTVESMFPVKADTPAPAGGNATQFKAALSPAKPASGIEVSLDEPAATTAAAPADPAPASNIAARNRWPMEGRLTPAKPGYWRDRLLSSARKWIEAFPTDAEENTPEEMVNRLEDGHHDSVKRVPGPDDNVPPDEVVARYREAHALVENDPDAWGQFVVPL